MYFQTLSEVLEYVQSQSFLRTEHLMVMVADKSSQHVKELTDYLNYKNIKFFGGIYAGLLVGHKYRTQGFIIQKVEPVYCSIVLPYMMQFKLDLQSIRNATAIVMIDGLSSMMQELINTIYNKLGKDVKYVGGGAGFYDLKHRPCIFDNKGIYKDVLYIAILKSNLKLAVKHGWSRMEGPFFVSKSEGNILSELDGDNAFEVYKYVIEGAENVTLCKEDFFVYAKEHPFGIAETDGHDIVRDPIILNEDNKIIGVASIPQGSDIYVLKGDIDTLLASSLQIAEECAAMAPATYIPMLFDCISRAMFMEERFEEELKNIQSRLKYPVEGALSIGEIASKNNGELVIHNKSTVLGLLEV